MLGAERRWDESWTATGLMVGGDAGVHVGSRVRLRGHVEGRAFLGAPSLAAANLGARWSPRPALALRLDVGLKGGWGTGAAWADQIGPGELAGWSTLSMELTPTRRWSAMADLNAWAPATSATSPTLVARAGVGVHASGQRLAPVSPERTLRYRAPDAAKVVVVGTFTDWQPRPMERQPDGTWTLTVVLPPGIHSYMYQVDGDTVTPPDAPLTSVDDFGLRQGVIIMPAPP